MDVVETELCDYLQVRHSRLESSPESPPKPGAGQQKQGKQPQLPTKFYKHWTSLWVVLHVEISPNYSYIGSCKKESDWLIDSQTVAKCFLDETFRVERQPPGYSKKFENVLQLVFKGYQLDLGFDSMTKLDQWFKALLVTSERHHVDLVRCHEHENLEGEYVVQVCPSSYLVWNPAHKPCYRPQWTWNLKHIRRVHWHKNVNKLEVEPGRSSDTGEGHFYFTGQHSYRLFRGMKHMMSTHAQITSPLPSRHDQQPNGVSRARSEREAGSGSESSDWTGTGEDWTGTSSDSAFINYIRSQRHGGSGSLSSSGVSPSPPPRSSSQGDIIYTHLNPLTINQDNQYASVDRLHSIAGKSWTLTPSISPLNSVSELGESLTLTEDDDYCKMVPNTDIRAGLLQHSAMSSHHLPLPPLPGENNVRHPTLSSPLPAHRQVPKHSNSLGEMYTPRE